MARFSLAVLAVLGSVSAVACGVESEAPETKVDSAESDVIGGIDATNPEFNAIGRLSYRSNDGREGSGCTGTLIAPQLVLTAKHCAMEQPTVEGSPTRLQDGKVYFIVGQNSAQPLGGIEVDSVELAPIYRGGYTRMGSDVALYHLKQAISTAVVQPIPIAPRALQPSDVGTSFIAIGYGTQDAVGTSGTRKIGAVRLTAITGAPAPIAFPNIDDYVASQMETVTSLNPGLALPPNYAEMLRAEYATPIANDYEAYVGRANALGEVQICHGDSGGPLLRRENGKLFIYGVASTTFGQSQLLCREGAMYATFGAATLKMITKALGDTGPSFCPLFQGMDKTPFMECVSGSCCAETSACLDEAGCSSLLSCYQACTPGDTSCTNGCYYRHEGDQVRYMAYARCAQNSCAATP